MSHQRYDQFYNIAKKAVAILCPGKEYKSIELLSGAKGIGINSDDENQTDYHFTFKSNRIYVYIRQGSEQKMLTELSWELGTISIKEIVDKIREKINQPLSPFGDLVLKKVKQI